MGVGVLRDTKAGRETKRWCIFLHFFCYIIYTKFVLVRGSKQWPCVSFFDFSFFVVTTQVDECVLALVQANGLLFFIDSNILFFLILIPRVSCLVHAPPPSGQWYGISITEQAQSYAISTVTDVTQHVSTSASDERLGRILVPGRNSARARGACRRACGP